MEQNEKELNYYRKKELNYYRNKDNYDYINLDTGKNNREVKK